MILALTSCNTQNKEGHIVNGLEYFEPVTFEGLFSALDNDSVKQYMESRCKKSFLETSEGVNFFPVYISSFVGLLFYVKGGPRGFVYDTYGWDLQTFAGMGSLYTEYYRPVPFSEYRNFVDSLSRHYNLTYSTGLDDSVAENSMVTFVIGKPQWNVTLSYFNKNLEVLLTSLPDSGK
jgi:hypothetical protein